MKKYLFIFLALLTSSCASLNPKVEDLQASPECQVWTKDIIGIRRVAEVKKESTKQVIKCWVLNMYLCSYNTYFVKEGTSEIHSSVLGKVGNIDGNKMSYRMTGSKTEVFEVKGNKVTYDLEIPIGPKVTKTVEYNKSCSARSAAVGLIALSQY